MSQKEALTIFSLKSDFKAYFTLRQKAQLKKRKRSTLFVAGQIACDFSLF
jgi:hypothetical protein